MEPVSSFAGGFGLISAGLGIHQSVKSKHVDTIYFQGASYKKPKKPVTGVVVDLSAGPLGLENFDIKNMVNTIAERTNYVESGKDKNIDEMMPRKTRTWMFVLDNPLKRPSFERISNDNVVLDLPSCVNIESNQSPPLRSRALEIQNFDMTKSFALNIELSAVPGKLVSDKLISLKKIFYHVNSFGRASTPSKFPDIIRSSFTSEFSLNKTREMAICENILVNDDVKKANSHSDWKVIVKEIPIDLPRSAVELVFSKFGKIVSIKMQLIGLWQKVLVEFKLSEVASQVASMWDQHWTLLYTLPVGTTAYDLFDLLVSYGGKSCFIGHNLSSYVYDRCAVICFGDETSKLAAIGTVPIFKGANLHWAGLFLACCSWCKQFGHISVNCLMGGNSGGCGRWVVSD
ncbi:hypothetical protein G9A89_001528 [Geosiphon pyriformis]|nr:hypothetical protein G9A89_001528 [Geosiphon pyriformis]